MREGAGKKLSSNFSSMIISIIITKITNTGGTLNMGNQIENHLYIEIIQHLH